ncbi:MAG: stage III sporulation protein AA [Clostridiales bacterium]|nr:stage III sporulation protein AA [Clostridiales bacterium]
MYKSWSVILAKRIRSVLEGTEADSFDSVEEIHLRVGKPLAVTMKSGNYYVSNKGKITKKWGESFIVKGQDIEETLEYVSSYSRYAYEEEIRQGFITIKGGHRVGVSGEAVVNRGVIQGLKYLNGLNIRIARSIPGCSDSFFSLLYPGRQLNHVAVISPPGCGKTTILRDLVRKLSDGTGEEDGYRVSLVDERGELAACYQGIPQNDVGRNTDILGSCPKSEGMMMMVRSLNPQILAVDEIGTLEDWDAMEKVFTCGIHLLATAHAGTYQEFQDKLPEKFRGSSGMFQRILSLHRDGKGQIGWEVKDASGKEIGRGCC